MTEANPAPAAEPHFPYKRVLPWVVIGLIVYNVLYHYFQTIVQPLVMPLCTAALVVTMISCTNKLIRALEGSSAQIEAGFARQVAEMRRELEPDEETHEVVH